MKLQIIHKLKRRGNFELKLDAVQIKCLDTQFHLFNLKGLYRKEPNFLQCEFLCGRVLCDLSHPKPWSVFQV